MIYSSERQMKSSCLRRFVWLGFEHWCLHLYLHERHDWEAASDWNKSRSLWFQSRERKRRPVERFDESSFLEIEEEGRRSLSRKTSQALHDHCIRVSTQNKLFMLHRLSILSFYTIFCLWVVLHSWLRSRNHFASFSERTSRERVEVEQEEWLDGWMHVDSHSFPFTFIHVLPVKSVINETWHQLMMRDWREGRDQSPYPWLTHSSDWSSTNRLSRYDCLCFRATHEERKSSGNKSSQNTDRGDRPIFDKPSNASSVVTFTTDSCLTSEEPFY